MDIPSDGPVAARAREAMAASAVSADQGGWSIGTYLICHGGPHLSCSDLPKHERAKARASVRKGAGFRVCDAGVFSLRLPYFAKPPFDLDSVNDLERSIPQMSALAPSPGSRPAWRSRFPVRAFLCAEHVHDIDTYSRS
jgi:hypothetical protein